MKMHQNIYGTVKQIDGQLQVVTVLCIWINMQFISSCEKCTYIACNSVWFWQICIITHQYYVRPIKETNNLSSSFIITPCALPCILYSAL